jgi:collagenase-like PrtC family protease
MCVLNNYTIDFLVENNVTRIIFPRNISYYEIEEIAEHRNKHHKDLELELFINDSLLYTC